MGASTFKYTTPLPYIGQSEGDSKLYTYFDFCGEKNHKHLTNMVIYKAKQFMLTIFSRKVHKF